MLVRIFTLIFDSLTGRFDDDPVRDFLVDKEAISIDHHFFVKDGTPYLALVLCYRLSAPAPVRPQSTTATDPTGARRERDESWRDTLDKSDWPLFNTLRDWRGERARAQGIPSYVVCNNRQLAAVVAKRPATLPDLGHIDGFGDAKLKKYGQEILSILAKAGPRPPRSADAAPNAPEPANPSSTPPEPPVDAG
jgi:superfamily II DNA helicase RecQ